MYIRHPINIIFGPTAANFPFHVGIVCSGGAIEENVCAVLPSDHPSCSLQPLPCSFYLLKFSSFAISHYVNSARVRPTYSNVCGGWMGGGRDQGDHYILCMSEEVVVVRRMMMKANHLHTQQHTKLDRRTNERTFNSTEQI